jgi:hypothetical protein
MKQRFLIDPFKPVTDRGYRGLRWWQPVVIFLVLISIIAYGIINP